MSVQLRRIPVPLVSGGINDSAADQGGMGPYDNLELVNGVWVTPSSVGPRRGSYLSEDHFLDAAAGNNIQTICHLDYWEGAQSFIVLGHTTLTTPDKHFLYVCDPDGSEPSSPPIAMPTAYEVATAQKFSTAGWFGDRFYGCDIGQTYGMWKFNTTVVSVYQANGANTTKPKMIFTHRNHLLMLCAARDGTVIPDRIIYSDIGDPDTVNVANFMDIGQDAEPLTIGVSLGEHAILFKEKEAHLLSGAGRQSWTVRPLDLDIGCVGPRHAIRFAGWVWFVSKEGFARIAPGGPAQMIVDRVRLRWDQLDEMQNAWVSVLPERRLVLFGVHHAEDPGTYPNHMLAVHADTGAWSFLDYGFDAFHGVAVPQGASPGPTGPPTYAAETNVGIYGWTANWTNGDTRDGCSTRHESQDVDAAGSFIEDLEEPVPDVTGTIAGKNPGRHYKERYRHERFGIYSTYSAEGDVYLTLAPPAVDAWGNGTNGAVQVDVSNPNDYSDTIEIQRCGDSGGAPDGNWSTVHTITPALAGCNTWVNTGLSNGTLYWFRARVTRSGHTTSAYGDPDQGRAGVTQPNQGLCS